MSDGCPVGTTLFAFSAASERSIFADTVEDRIRWCHDDSGDEVTDEILAWAAADEANDSRAGTRLHRASLAGRWPG
jgi:hypothetical protein